jgi:hypothetical protein
MLRPALRPSPLRARALLLLDRDPEADRALELRFVLAVLPFAADRRVPFLRRVVAMPHLCRGCLWFGRLSRGLALERKSLGQRMHVACHCTATRAHRVCGRTAPR